MDFRGGIQKFDATYENFGAHMLGSSKSHSAWKSAVSRDVTTHTAEREASGYPGIRVIPGKREVDNDGNVISATPASWDIEAFPHLVKILEITRELERQNRRKPYEQRMKRETLYDEAFKLAQVPRVETDDATDESTSAATSKAEENEQLTGYRLAVQRVESYARSVRLKLRKEAEEQAKEGIDVGELSDLEMATCNLLIAKIKRIFELPADQLKRKLSEDDIAPAPTTPPPVVKNSRTSVADADISDAFDEVENPQSGVENATGNASFSEQNQHVSVQSGDGLEQAHEALTVLSSLGVEKINVLICDDAKQERLIAERERLRFQGLTPKEIRARGINPQVAVTSEVTTISKLRPVLAQKMKHCESHNLSFIVDPRPSLGQRLIQVDEASIENLDFLALLAAYSIVTSDGNGQSMIVLPEGTPDKECDEVEEKLFSVLKPLGCNKGSSGASRWPGSFNFKPKRKRADGTFPTVTLHTFSPGRIVTPEELKDLGLQPELEKPQKQQPRKFSKLPRDFVPYDYSRASTDRSGADWKFVKANRDIGWTQAHIEAELRNISDKAQDREKRGSNKYVEKTVRKAFNSPDTARQANVRTTGSV
jgi:hypothetical protein